MSITDFSHHHPQTYRRVLVISCLVLTATGLYSASNQGSPKVLAMGQLALTPPGQTTIKQEARPATQKPAALGTLTRLPGKDGSATARATATLASVPLEPVGDVKMLGRAMNAAHFGDNQWPALNNLWTRESNWNPAARNGASGACGIPQALPCSKIPDMSTAGQIAWGLTYIERRYGTPVNAWQHWLLYRWY